MSAITVIKLGGQVTNVTGDMPKIGSTAPNFTLVDKSLQDATLETFAGKRKILNIFPSIDTRTCATSVRTFNQHAASLSNTVVLNISADLPFAQGRFCVIEGIDKAISLSTMRGRDFMVNYGVLISSGPMAGLCARAVIVLDENNIVKHVELVQEIADEPDYQAALNALK